VKTAIELPEAVKQAIAGTTRVTQGLNTFLLKPDTLKVVALFDHILPSVHLDVHVYANHGQHIVFNTTQLDLSIRELMKDVVGEGAAVRLAQRKLDNLGYIKAHGGIEEEVVLLSCDRLGRNKDRSCGGCGYSGCSNGGYSYNKPSLV
jgi:hypothetical protein